MLWSILIAAIPERYHTVQPLLFSLLETQGVARMSEVELIYLLDNQRRPVGAKRNALLDAARGEYISFVDDDDEVAPTYVSTLYKQIARTRRTDAPTDVICFPQRALLVREGVTHECSYSLRHWQEREPAQRRQLTPTAQPGVFAWSGPPAHTMVWRRGIAAACRFPEQQFAEDVAWVDKCCALAKSEIQIVGEPLYVYKFDSERSATR